jgi:ketosteroid isomerase-like protein
VSQENAKPVSQRTFATVVDGWECYNRHDFDAMEAHYWSDAVLDVSRVYLDERPRRGREEMRAYWERMWDISAGLRMDPVEVLDVGRDRYLVMMRFGQRGKRSGADVEQEVALIYTMRESLVARVDMFADREQALKAVGVTE